MPEGIVNLSAAELLVSCRQVHLHLRSVLIESCYSAQAVQCPATLYGVQIVFLADEQLHHIKPPLDLKLISHFAGRPPTERSGWEAAVKREYLPAKLELYRRHRPWRKVNVAEQQVVCTSALQNTHLWWSGREFQSSDGAAPFASTRTAPRSPLSDTIQCK